VAPQAVPDGHGQRQHRQIYRHRPKIDMKINNILPRLTGIHRRNKENFDE
jgi:hypothetical protein